MHETHRSAGPSDQREDARAGSAGYVVFPDRDLPSAERYSTPESPDVPLSPMQALALINRSSLREREEFAESSVVTREEINYILDRFSTVEGIKEGQAERVTVAATDGPSFDPDDLMESGRIDEECGNKKAAYLYFRAAKLMGHPGADAEIRRLRRECPGITVRETFDNQQENVNRPAYRLVNRIRNYAQVAPDAS